jgi:hypothetical protein
MKAPRLEIANPVTQGDVEALRRQVLVVPDGADAALRADIRKFVTSQPRHPLTVGSYADGGAEGGVREFVDSDIRRCDTVDLGPIATRVNEVFGRIIGSVVEPTFRVAVDYWSPPTALIYEAGGRNDLHFDSELPDRQPDGSLVWRRVNDRDFSFVWYLNSEFEGGNLTFPFLGLTLSPREGMVACFPSDHRFAHAAELVTGGIRIAIVTWASEVGTRPLMPPWTRVLNPRPGAAIDHGRLKPPKD